MTSKQGIAEFNDLTVGANGVWVRANADNSFVYSDGDAEEAYIRDVIQHASDKSSFSDELENAIHDWSSEYHLTSRRANALRGIDLKPVKTALEIGCGCGAISRYLGERGIQLDCVEGSPRRAEITRLRCEDLPNVRVINSHFGELAIPDACYDLVVLNGVLEYAGKYDPEGRSPRDAAIATLKRALAALKPDGFIFLAIENRLGFKYLAGATEDHFGVPWVGLDGYPAYDSPVNEKYGGIRTWDRQEWLALLEELGGLQVEFVYPFPDYKLPETLLSHSFATGSPYAWQSILRSPSRDYLVAWTPKIPEAQFWKTANRAGVLDQYANSFILLIEKNEKAGFSRINFDFLHFPALQRKLEHRVTTWKPKGGDKVRKQLLSGGHSVNDPGLVQHIEEEPYYPGLILSRHWIEVIESLNSEQAFRQLLLEYTRFLETSKTKLGNRIYDLHPGNIIIDEQGEYRAFDLEWEPEPEISADFVLFRALLFFGIWHHAELREYCVAKGIDTLEDFVRHGFSLCNKPEFDLDNLAGLEDRLQSGINTNDTASRVRETLQNFHLSKEQPAFRSRLYSGKAGGFVTPVYQRRLDQTRYCIGFDLPPEFIDEEVLRFDPVATVGGADWNLFKLHQLSLRTRDGTPVVEILEPDQLNRMVAPVDIRWLPHALGGVHSITGPHPQLFVELKNKPQIESDDGYRLEIQIEWPPYTSAQAEKDEVLVRESLLEEKLRQRERQVMEMQLATEELALIKRSKAWKFIQNSRGLVYETILGKTPVVRGLFLTAKKYGLKQVAGTVGRLVRSGHRKEALNALKYNVETAFDTTESAYDTWLRHHALTREALARQRENALQMDPRPLISIVMPVWNTDPDMLKKAINSVLEQTYDHWELCIADDASTKAATRRCLKSLGDPRIKVTFLEENLNIAGATNAAIATAAGDYIGFMDHDDELSPDALYEMVSAINESGAELLYSDEDFIDFAGQRSSPHFKPDYSPDLLLSHNYITHFVVVKRELVEQVGGLRSEFNGAQDYDFLLRVSEQTGRINHVPKILYHWRILENSTSFDSDTKPAAHTNGQKALQAALQRRGIAATIESGNQNCFYRVRRELHKPLPLVSIVIPFRDKPELLRTCIDSILEKSSYHNFEIIGVSNNSEGISTYELMRQYQQRDARIRFVEKNEAFNFSRLVNYGAEHARGEHLVMMNNDIEIITTDWIEALLEHSQRPEVGVVGAKLYYAEELVQHAGVIVGLGGYAAHSHRLSPRSASGYFNRLNIIQNLSAVTAALFMVKKSVWQEVEGFDEWFFGIAYNDVDFCLRVREKGYLNVFTPYAEAYHYESLSRGYDDIDPVKTERFDKEKEHFYLRYTDLLRDGDPYYNVNLTRDAEDFQVRTRFD